MGSSEVPRNWWTDLMWFAERYEKNELLEMKFCLFLFLNWNSIEFIEHSAMCGFDWNFVDFFSVRKSLKKKNNFRSGARSLPYIRSKL